MNNVQKYAFFHKLQKKDDAIFIIQYFFATFADQIRLNALSRMEIQKVIISHQLETALAEATSDCKADRTFVLLDKTTKEMCWPIVRDYDCMAGAETIVIPAGDLHKELDSVVHVWNELQRMGATRHSLLINLGGGVVHLSPQHRAIFLHLCRRHLGG